MKTKQLLTTEDFEALKPGDLVVCEFKRNMYLNYRCKGVRFKAFDIALNRSDTKEIILQRKTKHLNKSNYACRFTRRT